MPSEVAWFFIGGCVVSLGGVFYLVSGPWIDYLKWRRHDATQNYWLQEAAKCQQARRDYEQRFDDLCRGGYWERGPQFDPE